MSALFQITAVNAASAVFLAVVAGAAGRYVRRPAVVHALWLVVLLQLLMPPVLEIGVLPNLPVTPEAIAAFEPVPRASALATVSDERTPLREPASSGGAGHDVSAAAGTRTTRPRVNFSAVALSLWFVGSALVLVLALVRADRFRRLLRIADTAEPALESRVARLARRMAVRAPRLRLVRAPISPLIWPRLGGAELLFPLGLLSRLNTAETDALLAHELAHVARKDHWVRLLELIVVSLFWWHPVVWWARSRLRMAEERCCDQRVMRIMHRQRPSYARGLLKTVEFLAGTGRRVPALASGVGEVRDLEDRLTMIMKERPPKSLSAPRRIALAFCAVSALVVFPTWTDHGPDAAVPEGEAIARANDDAHEASEQAYRNSLLELERQAFELEHALREVRAQQRELEHEWGRTVRSSESARVTAETAPFEAARARDDAVALHEEAEALEREMALEARRADLERDVERRIAELELPLRRMMLEKEQASAEGDLDRVADLELQLEELEQYLQQLATDRELEVQQFERQLAQVRLERLLEAGKAHRAAGHDRHADQLEAEARAMLEELRWVREQQAREDDVLRRERQIEELSSRIRALEAEARDEEARQLIHRRERLERDLELRRSY